MRNYLFLILALFVAACSRSVHQQKTETKASVEKSVSETVVEASSKVLEQSETIGYSGDSLTGSIYFPFGQDTTAYLSHPPLFEDSLFTQNLKIRVGIIPFKGGYKARVTAVSKPYKLDKTTKVYEVNTRKSSQERTEKQATVVNTKQTDRWSIGLLMPICLILLIVGWFIYAYRSSDRRTN